MSKKYTILIIDDEINIHTSINGILEKHEFKLINEQDPRKGIEQALTNDYISLVILDIWMPDIDGIKVLEKIRKIKKELPILIMSGHASIDTAIQVTKTGANDFLEKPFSAGQLLKKIRSLLKVDSSDKIPSYLDVVNSYQELFRETNQQQKTIKKSKVLTGQGLHSGIKTGIICSPLPPNSGIIFEDLSLQSRVPAIFTNVKSTSFATSLKIDKSSVMCIEHLMAVFNIYGIDNILVKINGEIPIFDGSALQFCDLIEDCGIEEQDKLKRIIKIDKEISYCDPDHPDKIIKIKPHPCLAVDYFLQFPPSFGKQEYSLNCNKKNAISIFKKEIAPARTFGFIDELKQLQKAGLGAGGTLDNFILIDEEKVINTELRFQNEFARHKILDILGDLYLLGASFQGKITANRTGHYDNIQLIKQIIKDFKQE